MNYMKKIIFIFVIPVLLYFSCKTTKTQSTLVDHYNYSIQKKVIAENGAVVSAHALASKVGIEILKKGGNAIDAAIATQLALAVVYPNAGNLGGGGFMVARLHDARLPDGQGKLVAIDYREKAPGKAHRDMYLNAAGEPQLELSQNGHLSAGVPGTVSGLFESAKYANLSFEKLIQPAIDLAEKGFAISEKEARAFNGLKDEFLKYSTKPTAFVKNVEWKAGDTLVQKDLAATLRRIKKNGARGFYEGETANLIVEEMKRGNGIISLDDLKNYKAAARSPHVFDYKGYTIVGMPMPSSGGLLVHQMMKMIEDKPIASYGFQSPEAVQLMVEAERRAYADRAQFMGDADFYKVPVVKLTSDKYLKERMADFLPGKASKSEQVKPGDLPATESEETTHLSVIDKEGNAVAVTTTLNNSYGSKTVVGGAGFILNDEMDDFSVKPGVPNMYGAIGGEANAIMPGKRMLSSMTPTLVLKDGMPYLVIGTPGGTTIPTSVFQTLINILDLNMSTEDAVWKPKFHHQWLPDEVYLEKGFPATTKTALTQMGYKTSDRSGIGRTEVIKVLPDKKFEAIADNRGDDSAEGW
jgi:gamma-glutamyltranspeptidase/glutathione hydrolase